MARGSRSHRRTTWIARAALVGTVIGLGLLVGSASAVVPPFAGGFFELDGNVTSQGHDDWATLNGGGGSAVRFSGISEDVVNGTEKASQGIASNVCSTILPSGSTLTSCDDVATGGNTKDDLDFSSWNWIWQQSNDKTDIEHTFAALYQDTSGTQCNLDADGKPIPDSPVGCNPAKGHNFAVFGLDRFSNSGSASVGFWFTRDAITLTNPGPPNNSPQGTFVGTHQNGDLLVQSDFTSGGS